MGTYRNKKRYSLGIILLIFPAILTFIIIAYWDPNEPRMYGLLIAAPILILSYISLVTQKVEIKEGNIIIRNNIFSQKKIHLSSIEHAEKKSNFDGRRVYEKIILHTKDKEIPINNSNFFQDFLPELNSLISDPARETPEFKEESNIANKKQSKSLMNSGITMLLMGIIGAIALKTYIFLLMCIPAIALIIGSVIFNNRAKNG